MAYSQGAEETEILQALGAPPKVGHFLDIGAYNGTTFSNTYRLVELGWSGVCVEPSPSVFPALLKLHEANPRIAVVNSALAPRAGFIEFWDAGGDALSTSDEAHRLRWINKAQVPFHKLATYAITWEMLFNKFSHDFDFISVDVEGTNYDLFMTLPLQMLAKTKVIIVEHDGRLIDMLDYAKNFGYHYQWHNYENLIMMR